MFVQICGYQRSGTSFLSSLINKHSDVYITGETPRNQLKRNMLFLRDIDGDFSKIGGKEKDAWLDKRDEYIRNMFLATSKYKEDYAAAHRKTVFGNKLPRGERHWELLANQLEDVKIIYCIRDPKKVISSKMNMYRTSRNFDYNLLDYERSIDDLMDMKKIFLKMCMFLMWIPLM